MYEKQLLRSKQAGHFVCSQGNGKVDGSAQHSGVGNGQEMTSVFAGQAENGAQIRDATSGWNNHFESRFRSCRVLDNTKVHNWHRTVSRIEHDHGIDDRGCNRVVKQRVRIFKRFVSHSHSIGHEEHGQR